MKKILPILLLLLSLHLCLGQASQSRQTQPNFSGAWVLSKFEEKKEGKVLREGNSDNGTMSVVITHLEQEIRMSYKVVLNGKEYNSERILYTDGREQKSLTPGGVVIKTRTKWNKNKLVSRSWSDIPVVDKPSSEGTGSQETVEEWELSSDGKTLTHTTKISFRLDKFSTAGIPLMKAKGTYTRIS